MDARGRRAPKASVDGHKCRRDGKADEAQHRSGPQPRLPVEGCGGQIEAESEGEMKQVGARHDIIREWRSLPKEQRQTDEQAEAFAMQIKDKYKFSNDSADPYQTVRGWLLSYLSLMRGLRVNAKDKGEMTDDEKSADPGLSVAERKALRSREAQEAISDHEKAQKAFHANRERLREARLAREAVAGPMLYPAPELPDDTPIENVRFSTRIRNAVTTAGWKTVGEIREASDATLLGLQDLGPGSVTSLRETLGLPSTDGVRPVGLGLKAKAPK